MPEAYTWKKATSRRFFTSDGASFPPSEESWAIKPRCTVLWGNHLVTDHGLSLNRPRAAHLPEELELWEPVDRPESGPKKIMQVFFLYVYAWAIITGSG